jgi:DNA-binding GntR family transcriptional regulator
MTEPVELYPTKSDYAYQRLRELILSGELEPGAVINQEILAKRIGISTTPLREALRRLKQSGMVELGAHKDARVATLNAEEARDLLELRRSLDPLAVGLAAERRTKADIAGMRAALTGLQPLPGHPEVSQLIAHRRFHTTVYEASHNDLLIETLDGLWDKADRYRLHGLQVERSDEERAQKAHEHTMLVELIVAGDTEGAAQVMRDHIDTSLGAKSAWRLMKPAEKPGPA